ncbi:exported hypothetical protein [metagenome]|uniref:Uncharacterized protein n=1 Tax=metagenome TaxID=256318 RepID=A0A2P2BWL0_9ZZZZ
MAQLRTRLAVAAVALATITTGALAGPASAEAVTIVDGPDASGSLGDILDVRINHAARRVIVKTELADLRASSEGGPSGLNIWLDTDPSTTGPDFVFRTGLQAGQDFTLQRTNRFKPIGEPLTCDHRVRFDRAADIVRLSVARPCLGRPEKVRIAERMRDDFDGSHPIIDWLKRTRHLTRWVAHN